MSNFTWLYIDNDIAFLTAYNRTLKKTKTPDAMIGATAIHHERTLITNNARDFIHLPITIVNPLD